MIEDGDPQSTTTADQVARAGTSYDWLASVDGVLHWVESSPQTGRAVVMRWHPSWSLSGIRTTGLPDVSVGSGLHAYGGTPYAVLPSSGLALVNASTGQITGLAAPNDTGGIFGDLACFGGELLCVREHAGGDDLVAIDTATGTARVLRATDGFLASPRLQTGRLAWVRWEQDVMPWDATELWAADYTRGGFVGTPQRVAGGLDESAIQPQWGEDGSLYFLSDRTGWWNLYRWRSGQTEAVAPMAADCATAPWESSYANYVLLPQRRIGMTVQHGPEHRLVVVEPDGEITPVEVPYTSIKPYLAAVDGRIALIGASPTRSQQIALVATDGSDQVDVVRQGSGHGEGRIPLSVPQLMRVSSGDAEVTVLFYPPVGQLGPAPLIVRPHAGPTYHSDLRLDWEVQFFTSRGFAVADLDYRGSTGYGRAFRKALDGNWGRFDVEDCHNVAEHLLATRRAKPGAVFISGASAGGYTALRAVCQDGPFCLAVARSAIVDPKRWTTTAPRFQRPHAAILAHDSASVTVEQVQRPVLLVHGDRDDVAPIEDVANLAAGLDGRGLLAGMLKLEGVGHYLSKPAALAAALEAELNAYQVVLNRSDPLRSH